MVYKQFRPHHLRPERQRRSDTYLLNTSGLANGGVNIGHIGRQPQLRQLLAH